MLTLQNVIDSIKEPDQEAADLARRRWDSVAKPLNSLGALERDLVRIAGVQGTPRISIGSRRFSLTVRHGNKTICCGMYPQ